MYTAEEEQYIHDHYLDFGARVMVRRMEEIFGHRFTLGPMKSYRKKHGLQSHLTGQFPKGNVPWSAGKHPKDYCSDEAYASMARTQFRKGLVPHNQVPVGTEVVREGYLWRKISDTSADKWKDWKQVHHILWEEANGPVPEGKQLIFLNGDRSDIRLENLVLMDNRQRGYYKKFQCSDEEVQGIGLLVTEIKMRTEEPQKKEKNQK